MSDVESSEIDETKQIMQQEISLFADEIFDNSIKILTDLHFDIPESLDKALKFVFSYNDNSKTIYCCETISIVEVTIIANHIFELESSSVLFKNPENNKYTNLTDKFQFEILLNQYFDKAISEIDFKVENVAGSCCTLM
eukprot:TRINITY_DN14122_c0_g1_i1.p1 TRINITY_DN14122_c0_g1~~TRINITY_DN14122_c0_g1_i1.p1  ORF type:complete len:154 (-),score=42.41 TRINITY_DN14122_c0_g1_i1:259-675(-)